MTWRASVGLRGHDGHGYLWGIATIVIPRCCHVGRALLPLRYTLRFSPAKLIASQPRQRPALPEQNPLLPFQGEKIGALLLENEGGGEWICFLTYRKIDNKWNPPIT